MDRMRDLFSLRHLAKVCLIAGIYILGRMEGEGRFHWGDVFSAVWSTSVTVSSAAVDSARGIIKM